MHRTHTLLIGTLLLGLLSACQPGKERTQLPISAPTTELPPPPSSTRIPPTQTMMPTETLPPPTPTRHIVQSLLEQADLGTGKGPVYSQDWSPDGLLLVTTDTALIRIWDVTTRQESGILSGHVDYIWGLKWSPITAAGVITLASASQDGTVRLWDIETGTAQPPCKPVGHFVSHGRQMGSASPWALIKPVSKSGMFPPRSCCTPGRAPPTHRSSASAGLRMGTASLRVSCMAIFISGMLPQARYVRPSPAILANDAMSTAWPGLRMAAHWPPPTRMGRCGCGIPLPAS